MPHLTDFDLRQMDEAWLESLPEPVARAVLVRVVDDLKEARDRLNQPSGNSSCPPGSRPPWENRRRLATEPDAEEAGDSRIRATDSPTAAGMDAVMTSPKVPPAESLSGRKPGKPRGSPGTGGPSRCWSMRWFTVTLRCARPVAHGSWSRDGRTPLGIPSTGCR